MGPAFHISLQQVGKKFYRRWIFRDISLQLSSGDRLAMTGSNGSGKSTLLSIIAGQLAPSEGKVSFRLKDQPLDVASVYKQLSWAGPGLELYPDLNLEEHLRLHFRFKPCLLPQWKEAIPILRLEKHRDKSLRYYSSGMMQRVKVGIALFSQSELLLLDEPTSNMDEANAAYMLELIEQYQRGRILILASNLGREFERFKRRLEL